MKTAQIRQEWTLVGARLQIDMTAPLTNFTPRLNQITRAEAIGFLRRLNHLDGVTGVYVATRYEVAVQIAPLFDVATIKSQIAALIAVFYGAPVTVTEIDATGAELVIDGGASREGGAA